MERPVNFWYQILFYLQNLNTETFAPLNKLWQLTEQHTHATGVYMLTFLKQPDVKQSKFFSPFNLQLQLQEQHAKGKVVYILKGFKGKKHQTK